MLDQEKKRLINEYSQMNSKQASKLEVSKIKELILSNMTHNPFGLDKEAKKKVKEAVEFKYWSYLKSIGGYLI
jgi:hypothetical protein